MKNVRAEWGFPRTVPEFAARANEFSPGPDVECMDEDAIHKRVLFDTLAFVLVPSALVIVGLWADSLRPDILDVSDVSVLPASVVAVLGVALGVVVASGIVDGPPPELWLPLPDGLQASTVRSWTVAVVLVCCMAGMVVLVGVVAGEPAKYSVLMWLTLPYGVAIVEFAYLDRVERSPDDPSYGRL